MGDRFWNEAFSIREAFLASWDAEFREGFAALRWLLCSVGLGSLSLEDLVAFRRLLRRVGDDEGREEVSRTLGEALVGGGGDGERLRFESEELPTLESEDELVEFGIVEALTDLEDGKDDEMMLTPLGLSGIAGI